MTCICQRNVVEFVAKLIAVRAFEVHLRVWLDVATHQSMGCNFQIAEVCSALICEQGMACGSSVSDPDERGCEDVDCCGEFHLHLGQQRNKLVLIANQFNF